MQQKFAMNKALEQKLIGPMEESHTKQQSPKAVLWVEIWARRSKIAAKRARTRVWAGGWFFLEEDEVCGCWNKWRGATRGPRDRGHAQVGWARPPLSWPGAGPSCSDFSALNPQIFHKNHTKFAGHLEHFYFRDIFYCTDNSENRRIILFLLYLF